MGRRADERPESFVEEWDGLCVSAGLWGFGSSARVLARRGRSGCHALQCRCLAVLCWQGWGWGWHGLRCRLVFLLSRSHARCSGPWAHRGRRGVAWGTSARGTFFHGYLLVATLDGQRRLRDAAAGFCRALRKSGIALPWLVTWIRYERHRFSSSSGLNECDGFVRSVHRDARKFEPLFDIFESLSWHTTGRSSLCSAA